MTGVPEQVAVIVPNYNKGRTLRACLAAVYAQTHPPAEVIVVDDASTDDSREIARDFPCRLIAHPTNRGVSAARNAGAAAATAPLLFFVDSDIALAPDAIGNAVRALRADPELILVQGIYAAEPLIDDGPVEVHRTLFEHYWRRRSVGTRTATMFALSLIPRAAFLATGGQDEELRDGEDVEFGTRLPGHYRTLSTETVLGRHDDVDRLLPMLWEQFSRASNGKVLLKTWSRRDSGATGTRMNMMSPPGLLLAGLSLLTTALGVFLPGLLLLLPPLLVGTVLASHDFLRFVRQRKGTRFTLLAAGIHLLLYLTVTAGAGLGLLRAAVTVAWRTVRPPRPDPVRVPLDGTRP